MIVQIQMTTRWQQRNISISLLPPTNHLDLGNSDLVAVGLNIVHYLENWRTVSSLLQMAVSIFHLQLQSLVGLSAFVSDHLVGSNTPRKLKSSCMDARLSEIHRMPMSTYHNNLNSPFNSDFITDLEQKENHLFDKNIF